VPQRQEAAPLVEALQEYVRRRPAIFHVPGHKQGRGAPRALRRLLGRAPFQIDLTEAPGLDDLHAPEGVIAQAEKLAAEAFGAGASYFLVGGSTAGLHGLILAACHPGGKVLLPRHVHRSVVGALILAGVRPIWLQPDYAEGDDFAWGLATHTLQEALQRHSDADLLVLTHPTYHGIASPLAEQVALAHAAGLTVITDEAHGAHYAFAPAMPSPALAAAADGTVQSLHKTGGSLTQSSICHRAAGGRLEERRLREMLRLVQSTSPSYLLMASLDAARRQLALHGRQMWERAVAVAAAAKRAAGDLLRTPPPPYTADPTRLLFDLRATGISGLQAAHLLWEEGFAVESAGSGHLLALVTPGDGRRPVLQLAAAVRALGGSAGRSVRLGPPPVTDAPLPPREAYLGPKESVLLNRSRGRIAAELIAPYPPGIAVLVPGERVTAEVVDYLSAAVRAGYRFQGPADLTLRTIQVVRE
jgi:arginine decarboxylase